MTTTAAKILAEAIEQHRDRKYSGAVVGEPLDSELYGAVTWYRTYEDHATDPDGPIPDP